jgi:hypothetical protein
VFRRPTYREFRAADAENRTRQPRVGGVSHSISGRRRKRGQPAALVVPRPPEAVIDRSVFLPHLLHDANVMAASCVSPNGSARRARCGPAPRRAPAGLG